MANWFAVGRNLEQKIVTGRQVEKESFCSLKIHASHTTTQYPNGKRVERLYPVLAVESLFTFKLLPNELP